MEVDQSKILELRWNNNKNHERDLSICGFAIEVVLILVLSFKVMC